ncbi:hypothetical protein H261_08638 [Paramagnetospirillum caucaseum]|uniref:DUF805 domain-containing protein n=1 Tax=Paramagnetospirillum caucaseum TaxID=1244869 RepID=M2YBH4_9PROT|nr:DUF805 domain-containing protein [Paramagnetospirillum caucaseum]EME70376.1 hypothetical protein H261_08638 [Paramagnetospirillum caucaseum]
MDFMTAVKTCLGKYATFQGRAARSEYWFFTLFNIILSMIASVIAGASLGVLSVLPMILMIGLFLPTLAVSIRRLHDLDKPGWWFLIILVPVVGGLVLLWWFCRRGTEGQNMFGSDPLWTALTSAP